MGSMPSRFGIRVAGISPPFPWDTHVPLLYARVSPDADTDADHESLSDAVLMRVGSSKGNDDDDDDDDEDFLVAQRRNALRFLLTLVAKAGGNDDRESSHARWYAVLFSVAAADTVDAWMTVHGGRAAALVAKGVRLCHDACTPQVLLGQTLVSMINSLAAEYTKAHGGVLPMFTGPVVLRRTTHGTQEP